MPVSYFPPQCQFYRTTDFLLYTYIYVKPRRFQILRASLQQRKSSETTASDDVAETRRHSRLQKLAKLKEIDGSISRNSRDGTRETRKREESGKRAEVARQGSGCPRSLSRYYYPGETMADTHRSDNVGRYSGKGGRA